MDERKLNLRREKNSIKNQSIKKKGTWPKKYLNPNSGVNCFCISGDLIIFSNGNWFRHGREKQEVYSGKKNKYDYYRFNFSTLSQRRLNLRIRYCSQYKSFFFTSKLVLNWLEILYVSTCITVSSILTIRTPNENIKHSLFFFNSRYSYRAYDAPKVGGVVRIVSSLIGQYLITWRTR